MSPAHVAYLEVHSHTKGVEVLVLQDRTALHAASTPEIVRELTAHGADIAAKDTVVNNHNIDK